MIDLETLSTRPNASILSIGACRFDENGIDTDGFYVNIDPHSSKEYGTHVSKSTLKWWSEQSKEAIAQLQVDQRPLTYALDLFLEWYGSKSMKTWSNGASFDLPILSYSLDATNRNIPWKYYHGLCVRTITDLTGQKIDRTAGTAHNALDDAINQAKFMVEFLKQVKG